MTRVLIIDDDTELTDMLKLSLEPAGLEVNGANSSPEGISAALRWNPELIILDLMMPIMDGLTVCQAIRKFSQVPILVLSVLNKPETIAQALDAGADVFLNKPVPAGVLIAHINNLTRRARAELNARTAASSA